MANKFYVHNDIFRYEDEVFGDSEAELDEGTMLQNNRRALVFTCGNVVHIFVVSIDCLCN